MIIDSKLKGDEGENFVNEIVTNHFSNIGAILGPNMKMGIKKEICDLLIVLTTSALYSP